MLPESLILEGRTAFVVGYMRSSTICTCWFLFSLLGQFLLEWLLHTQHISVFSYSLVSWPKTLAAETLLDRGFCPQFLDLENYACFLAYKPSRNECYSLFWLSLFILIKSMSLLELLDLILSASAWVILLKSSSSLKSSSLTLVDTQLKAKILYFGGDCRVI